MKLSGIAHSPSLQVSPGNAHKCLFKALSIPPLLGQGHLVIYMPAVLFRSRALGRELGVGDMR